MSETDESPEIEVEFRPAEEVEAKEVEAVVVDDEQGPAEPHADADASEGHSGLSGDAPAGPPDEEVSPDPTSEEGSTSGPGAGAGAEPEEALDAPEPEEALDAPGPEEALDAPEPKAEPETELEPETDMVYKYEIGDLVLVQTKLGIGQDLAQVMARYPDLETAEREHEGTRLFSNLLRHPGHPNPTKNEPHYYCEINNRTRLPLAVAESGAERK